MLTVILSIGGMTCVNCQNRIKQKLENTSGINNASVNYNTSTANVTFDPTAVTSEEITAMIESLGYTAQINNDTPPALSYKTALQTAGIMVIILALSILLRAFGNSSLVRNIPLAQMNQDTGLMPGMIFIIGLLTSIHCIAMCGGINLSQSLGGGLMAEPPGGRAAENIQTASKTIEGLPLSKSALLFPGILYNGGRIISYTVVGILAGALGGAVTLSGRFQGALLLAAGIFMILMGINMLGLFPALKRITPRLPSFLVKKMAGQKVSRGPVVIGFLNGFMPCGPLQAMQLYALSTGSPVWGGISMFFFCLGTIPLMFALGTVSSILRGVRGRTFSRRVMQAGSIVIAAMGLTMFYNGWNFMGLANPLDRTAAFFGPAFLKTESGAFVPAIQNGVQIVNSILYPSRYPAITVQQGIPVRWIINAPAGSINSCNNRIFIREYGIEYTFKSGENVIEFTPAKTGRFRYSCWMAMIHSTITVVAEGQSAADLPEPITAPTLAGVQIPTDTVAVAQLIFSEEIGNYQAVTINLGGDGFEPAIVVMQSNLPALWTINVNSLNDPGNSSVIFPFYYTILDMRIGGNTIPIIPVIDFDFSTGNNIFYGYVKVEDDINQIDIDVLKREVANHKTLIYPESHFEPSSGCACCGTP
ncbi:MAG: sulfite exporter TauE/SafE family protein [Treponema sp.]|nr:sulfite exporter TauE/SafE family protein [Treponema sp.]